MIKKNSTTGTGTHLTFNNPPLAQGVASGIALWVVYIVWISVVLILYKPCVWYGKYKATSKKWWLKYI
jgi:hypothetical protein